MKSDFCDIKLFVTDVDGVMTDGSMYYFDNNTEGKKFNTRDGMGIQLLKSKGIKVGFMTQESNQLIVNRATKLNINFCRMGVMDKAADLDTMRGSYGLQWEHILYVGDDINDVEALKLAGISICPKDAMPGVIEVCDFVSPIKGGAGVIRDIYERYFK